jgi:hypothetical protein
LVNNLVFQCHKSLEELYDHVNMKILPKEYGGSVPIQDMIGNLYLYSIIYKFSIIWISFQLLIPWQDCRMSWKGENVVYLIISDDFKKQLSRSRERLLSLDQMEIELKTKQKLVSEFNDQLITGVAGSFRMLQVD